ncbi:MAG TPA: metallophosphoesterase [Anaerolineales bacterium]|nr:metallophosphoesterase [Anaerolineales bacterium]
MSVWFFVSDLHGHLSKYGKLWQLILSERPAAVLMGGDLLPGGPSTESAKAGKGFIDSVLVNGFERVKKQLSTAYPQVLLILGNDDLRAEEIAMAQAESLGLWNYMHYRKVEIGAYSVYGYACVPPTPFLLKDWERYDVSRFVDPGCISPEDGWRSFPISENEIRHGTIQADLARLVSDGDLSQSIFLFHAPPHGTALDRAALDGRVIDSVPLDVHVGSIAIRRFIMGRQPRVTLHGHIHESARLTGSWRERLGQTWAFSAAHDGAELALIRFDPANPASATRELI